MERPNLYLRDIDSHLYKTMKQIERASIVRIVSDLIKADGIIDTREIDFLDVLREKYAITKEDEFFAESCTFA